MAYCMKVKMASIAVVRSMFQGQILVTSAAVVHFIPTKKTTSAVETGRILLQG